MTYRVAPGLTKGRERIQGRYLQGVIDPKTQQGKSHSYRLHGRNCTDAPEPASLSPRYNWANEEALRKVQNDLILFYYYEAIQGLENNFCSEIHVLSCNVKRTSIKSPRSPRDDTMLWLETWLRRSKHARDCNAHCPEGQRPHELRHWQQATCHLKELCSSKTRKV